MSATPTQIGATTTLVELPGSPSFEFVDKARKTRNYYGVYSVCLASAVSKGDAGAGDESGWFVESCQVKRERGDLGTLTILWRAGAGSGEPLPADEHTCEPVETNPAVGAHPVFADVPEAARAYIQQAVDGHNSMTRSQAKTWLDGITASWGVAARHLAFLKYRGTETYCQVGMRYTWRQVTDTSPACTMGGYVEDPVTDAGADPPFTLPTLSWLRESDRLSCSNGIYTVDRSWLGGQNGYWDSLIYGVT